MDPEKIYQSKGLIRYQIVDNTFNHDNALLFVGNGNVDFGCRVASCFQCCNLSSCRIGRFANGEIKIPKIKENIRKRDCIVIQSICDSNEFGSVNDLLMELFVLIDACFSGLLSGPINFTILYFLFNLSNDSTPNFIVSPVA